MTFRVHLIPATLVRPLGNDGHFALRLPTPPHFAPPRPGSPHPFQPSPPRRTLPQPAPPHPILPRPGPRRRSPAHFWARCLGLTFDALAANFRLPRNSLSPTPGAISPSSPIATEILLRLRFDKDRGSFWTPHGGGLRWEREQTFRSGATLGGGVGIAKFPPRRRRF